MQVPPTIHPDLLTIPQLIRYGFGQFPAAQLAAEVAEVHPTRALECMALWRALYESATPGPERSRASEALSILSDLSEVSQ